MLTTIVEDEESVTMILASSTGVTGSKLGTAEKEGFVLTEADEELEESTEVEAELEMLTSTRVDAVVALSDAVSA